MTEAQELGLSEAEYADALLLQRVYQLISHQLKDSCPQCQIGSITYLDHIKVELYCSKCAAVTNKVSTKKIGDHKLTTRLVEELEIKYLTPAVVHRRTMPMTPPILIPDEDFNVWTDWPVTNSMNPRDSGDRMSIGDDCSSAADLPGMAGIIRQFETRPVVSAEIKKKPLISHSRAEPTISELFELLQTILENQKILATSMSSLQTRLDRFVGPAAPPPPFTSDTEKPNVSKASDEGGNSSNSTTDWPVNFISGPRIARPNLQRDGPLGHHVASQHHVGSAGGQKFDTRLIKSSVSRHQNASCNQRPITTTQTTPLNPSRPKAKRNPFRENPFT